jgi:PKD repeat protein
VLFTDTSTKAIAWAWDFGDGEAAMYRHPLHTYAVRGTYTVTLQVTDGVTTAQTTKTVTVGDRARLHLGQ